MLTCGQFPVFIWIVPMELKRFLLFFPWIEILGYDMDRGAASFLELNPNFLE